LWLAPFICRNIVAAMHRALHTNHVLEDLLAVILLVSSVASATRAQSRSAQNPPLSPSRLLDIKVTGSSRFTEAEITAASGLMTGATVDEEVFRKAARQLGESGAFNDVSYNYTYSSAGTKLIVHVVDADKFVPAHFGDFVWFSDSELQQKLHQRIPLFTGELPTSGRLPDQVSDILQALLVENHIPGDVQYLRSTAKDGKLEAFDYTVANIVIQIRHVEFPGAGSEELPQLQAAAEKLTGADYYRALLHTFAENRVLPIYHERGYLKAACDAPQPKVVKPTPADATDEKSEITHVDVVLAVTPGEQYKLAGWSWNGNKNVATDELQPLIHAKAGQIANTVRLADDLRAVQELYGSRGYVVATIKVNAQFNDAAGTVTYQLAVNEGEVYHMGELEFRGLDNNLTARLRNAWKLRSGDVYDANYLKEFLPQARRLLPANMDWDVASHVTAMTKDKTVDVDLQYTAKAPQ
jgi:outer membrane protein assembly factor BamA